MADNKKKPKKTGFSLQGFDVQSYKQTEKYVQAIDLLYNQAVQEFATLAGKVSVNPDKPFSFSDYPATQAKAQQIISGLASKMQGVIIKGSRDQWLYACKKNDEFLNHILNTVKIPKKQLAKFQDRNLDALDAFQKRKTAGMDLSKRIWNYTGQMKTQMELGIDIAVGEGKSAAQLSRDLRQYLVDPDKLFRKVRDKHGQLVLSKNAAAFHPGQGKYRSSYKNAMRLTRSEINMAYRQSDQLRWQQLDFVVGYEIKLSNNHTTLINGVPTPFKDICDELAGKYPKGFKWSGWHPQCRCHVVPILRSREETNEDEFSELQAAFKGTEYKKFESKNLVRDVPDNFKQWVADKQEASKGWNSAPYWVKDNFKNGLLTDGLKVAAQPQKTAITTMQKPATIVKPVILKPTTQAVSNIPAVKEISTAYSNVSKVIIAAEDDIRMNKAFETAVGYDKNGNKIIDKRGQASSVSFTDDEIMLFKDSVFTHNHPGGWKGNDNSIRRIGNSFSKNDIHIAIKSNMAEIRAVTPNYTFSMKRPEKGWPMSGDSMVVYVRKFENEVQNEMYSVINRASGSHLQTAINRAETLHWHLVWKRFCSKHGIEYTKAKTRE